MVLLVEYKCEQTIPSIYQLSTRNIKQVKDINNKHMQDIKTSEREREMSNHKHGNLFRGSSTLVLRSRLQHFEGLSLESIPQDHSVPQHLK